MPLRPIHILGGGLAGLSLAHALASRGVPVRLDEAGRYPRHRVCGEFMAGIDEATLTTLGIGTHLADALRHREVAWHWKDRLLCRNTLPTPALGLSRNCLDLRLATAVRAAGGVVNESLRAEDTGSAEGRVHATGRKPGQAGWVGLKVHLRALPTTADLEMHLAPDGYVGLSPVEDGRCNACGLFRASRLAAGGRVEALFAQLKASGLGKLAARLEAADPDPASFCAVTHLAFGPPARLGADIRLGDAHGVIPPFTGNGMTLALQSAATALHPLLGYARGERDWAASVAQATGALDARFRLRLRIASAFQPALMSKAGLVFLAGLARSRLLPFRALYSLTH